jgi:hypothetical protein
VQALHHASVEREAAAVPAEPVHTNQRNASILRHRFSAKAGFVESQMHSCQAGSGMRVPQTRTSLRPLIPRSQRPLRSSKHATARLFAKIIGNPVSRDESGERIKTRLRTACLTTEPTPGALAAATSVRRLPS